MWGINFLSDLRGAPQGAPESGPIAWELSANSFSSWDEGGTGWWIATIAGIVNVAWARKLVANETAAEQISHPLAAARGFEMTHRVGGIA
jgi:hypothetical protein